MNAHYHHKLTLVNVNEYGPLQALTLANVNEYGPLQALVIRWVYQIFANNNFSKNSSMKPCDFNSSGLNIL